MCDSFSARSSSDLCDLGVSVMSTWPDIANHFGSCADKHAKDWHVNSRESERALWFICEGGICMEAVARLFIN